MRARTGKNEIDIVESHTLILTALQPGDKGERNAETVSTVFFNWLTNGSTDEETVKTVHRI